MARPVTGLGTTETPFSGDPELVRPLPDERDYLLETLAHYFPAWRDAGAMPDVVDAFAGLRVLPGTGAGPASRRPREVILHPDRARRPRLVTVYGGKLTAYRATAARLVRLITPALPPRAPVARTDALPLTAPADTARPR